MLAAQFVQGVGSSALVIEIYAYPVEYFGFMFALTGAAILARPRALR
jgi:hypothetical protein